MYFFVFFNRKNDFVLRTSKKNWLLKNGIYDEKYPS